MRAQRDAHSDAHSGLMSRARSPWLGLFFLLLSVVAFGGSDITAKAMIGHLPPAELAWMRLATLFAVASVVAGRSGPIPARDQHVAARRQHQRGAHQNQRQRRGERPVSIGAELPVQQRCHHLEARPAE